MARGSIPVWTSYDAPQMIHELLIDVIYTDIEYRFDRSIDRWMDRSIDRWMDRCTEGGRDGWT